MDQGGGLQSAATLLGSHVLTRQLAHFVVDHCEETSFAFGVALRSPAKQEREILRARRWRGRLGHTTVFA
jgi:hypothetical protein